MFAELAAGLTFPDYFVLAVFLAGDVGHGRGNRSQAANE